VNLNQKKKNVLGNTSEDDTKEENTSETETTFSIMSEEVTVDVELSEGIPADSTLVVKTLESSDEDYTTASTLIEEVLKAEDATLAVTGLAVFDISLIDANGDEIENIGEATVTLTFDEPILTGAGVTVFHIKDGDAIELGYEDMTWGDNYEGIRSITFITDGFSPEAIAEVGYSANTIDDDGTVTITKVTATDATYEDETYTAYLNITFTVDVSEMTADSRSCSFTLPEGISPPSSYNGGTLIGTDASGKQAFTYVYVEDASGNWTVEITFDSDYDFGSNNTVDCYISFWATIDSSLRQDDDSLKVKFSDEVTLDIPASKITTNDNETPDNNISVSKSSSGYNAATNTITYTVTVSSTKGTGSDITLEDILTASGVDIASVTLDSVKYYDLVNSGWTTINETDLTNTYASSFTYDETTGAITLILSELTVQDITDYYGSEYVITYTVTLDSTDVDISGTVGNSVTATSVSTWNGGSDMESSDDTDVNVSVNLLSKSGTANSDGTITWTITVNSSGVDISGYTLTDAMFADAVGDISVSPSSNYTYDSATNTITFTADGSTGENTSKYTITYTTASNSTLASATVATENTATLDDGGSFSKSETGSVNANNGSVSKSFNGAETSSADTVVLNWTSTVNIPAGGITAGTVMGDYLGGDNYTTITNQWFTYSQISALLDGYTTSISLGDTDNTTLIAANGDYTIEVYSITNGWESYSTATNAETFTAFRITINKDVTLSSEGKITFTYQSTGDRSAIDGNSVKSVAYKNTFSVEASSTLSASASHTEYATVVKTDGNGRVGDSEISTTTNTTTSDGTITWIVKVFVPYGCTESYFTVTDSLPENVTLTSAKVEISGSSVTILENNAVLSVAYLNNGKISGSNQNAGTNDQQTVVISCTE